MKQLLNTLYINTPGRYLSLEGETIVVSQDGKTIFQLPLHNIGGIVSFGYTGASPALMGECARRNISLCFMSAHGNFLAGVTGEVNGNVLLRREQYRFADDPEKCTDIAKSMITAKLFNSRSVLERAKRDYPERLDTASISERSENIKQSISLVRAAADNAEIRGIEGKAAVMYFDVFDELILRQKRDFFFHGRNRRPPLDNVNALLSFSYSLLARLCSSALSSVGLDPYVGFLHTDRPGRASLALDMMEELRAVFADRFVLTLINKKILSESDFDTKENGAVFLTEDGRKTFFKAWQEKQSEQIKHPFLGEKLEWGMLPFVQAQLLARYIRGDTDAYAPFLWK